MNGLGELNARCAPDRFAIQVAAALRVSIALGLAVFASASAPSDDAATVWYLLVGLVWLPWASMLLLASDGRRGPLVLGGGPLGDVLVLFAAQCLVPLVGYVVVVGLGAALWTRRGAWWLAGASVFLTIAAQSLVPSAERLEAPALALLAAALAATVVSVRAMLGQRLAIASSQHLKVKADTILARVADGIIVTDGAGVILQCNPAGERLIGSRSPVGANCGHAVGLRTAEGCLDCSKGCALLRLGHQGDNGSARELWREHPDGRRQSLLASVSVVGDDKSGKTEVVHSLRDITRMKEADEAKTLFLATASHELKTPLTVISGFTDAMLAFPDMSPAQRQDALLSIQARASELGAIIERVLLSSKIEAGRTEMNPRQVEVVPFLKKHGDSMQTASGSRIVMQLRDEGLVVAADPLALGTVVDHLLDNAVKYSDGGLIALGAQSSGDGVEIFVTDSGIGMDDEQAAHCFDRFWQAESTDVRRFGGTGIGLYIVKSLVTAMGGAIAVQSAPGRGSMFSIWLPVESSVNRAGAQTAGSRPGVGNPSSIKEFMRQIGVPSKAAS